jgi:hypothetical protein
MNYRLAQIWPQKSYSADTTEIIDLDVGDPISQLIIELDVTNVGSIAPTAHAIACLTKIELVDGSDVLYSLSGYEAEAVDFYHNKQLRSNWNPYLDGMDVQRFIGINFGRYLWDPMLAFDPKKFRNPQLKLTLDINAGGNAPVTNKLRVWGAMFDQKQISPAGLLMHKEIKNYAMGSASHEYTDMPLDYPYRKLFIRAQSAGTEPDQLIDQVKLYEDEGKRIVIDSEIINVLLRCMSTTPIIIEQIYGHVGTTSTNGFCTPTSRTIGHCQRWATTTGAGEIAFYDGDGGRFKVIAATAASNMQAHVSGYAPHATYELPFGNQDDPADWYDISKVGSLKTDILSLTAGSGVDCQIFLQQMRPY